MKPLILFVILFALCLVSFAQVSTDSFQAKIDQATTLPELPDSLKKPWNKVDSIRASFNHEADSLNQAYQNKVGAIDRVTNKVNHIIDSLNNLKLPSNKFTRKLDSLKQEREKVDQKFNSKVSDLKSKTIGKLDKVEMTPGIEGPVGEFTQKVNGYSISNNEFVKIPPLQVKGYSIPQVGSVADIPSALGATEKLAELKQIDTPLGDVGALSKDVQGLGSDAKNVAEGNLNEVKHVDKAIENRAGSIEGVEELQKASGVAEEYQAQITELGDPDAVKKQALEMGKKEAINHFAGKEQQLKEAMDQMSKYKQKYSSVKSIKDLPKRPPNSMNAKPFIERLLSGVYLQFQSKNAWLLDVNPYAGYHISGKLTAGIGWNQRFAYDRKLQEFVPKYRIFGPRVFVDFKLGKGFNGHLETEYMNTSVPSAINANPDNSKREWVSSTMLGIKKQYKIYKNLNGTVLLQYNLYNPYYKAPYLDRLNSRMGFEYTLKKKKK